MRECELIYQMPNESLSGAKYSEVPMLEASKTGG